MRNKISKISTFIIVVTIFFSCKVQQKMPLYLENATNENINKQVGFPELKIQKNDLLAIQVYSDAIPKDANPDDLYNQPTPAGGGAGSGAGQVSTTSTGGYLVDPVGDITFPRIGKIHAEGLTKTELERAIRSKLLSPVELLKNPVVIVRFQSYKISTVGEFNAPQVLNVPTEKINIFEAVSMAGGITEWGKLDEVKVVRDQDGRREMGIINLASADAFNSPYYYLKQNDIVIVDPTNEKLRSKKEATNLARASLGLSIVSAALVIFNIFRK